jgi:hypothetical protein
MGGTAEALQPDTLWQNASQHGIVKSDLLRNILGVNEPSCDSLGIPPSLVSLLKSIMAICA